VNRSHRHRLPKRGQGPAVSPGPDHPLLSRPPVGGLRQKVVLEPVASWAPGSLAGSLVRKWPSNYERFALPPTSGCLGRRGERC